MRVETMRGPSRNAKLALAGGALAAGSVVSVIGLYQALRHEAGVAILWLGWLSLGLIVGSALCIFMAIAGCFQGRKKPIAVAVDRTSVKAGEYLAKYSVGDKAVALGIAAASAALATFFVMRSASWAAISISIALASWALFYLIQVTLTVVLFTDSGLVVRVPFRRQVSRSYGDVKRITGKPGTVKVEFSNGQAVELHTGLGNADIVISYLRRHCLERLETE